MQGRRCGARLALPFRGFERPRNSPVDCFQRERAGRPSLVAARSADGRGRSQKPPLCKGVRAPGEMSGGHFSARTGRQAPVGGRRPEGLYMGPGERDFLAAWFQTHRRPRKRAADSAALGFFESVRAGRACTNVQRRDCWKQMNFAAVHVAHGLARSKVEAILPAAKLVASRLNLTIPKGLANSPWRTMPPRD